ncbi:MAG: TIGR03084 family metal-binding protein [Deltaproteobacteria bacterium]
MLQESDDFRAEADVLHEFLTTLPTAAWDRPTAFLGWTPWDVVAHLHYFDLVSELSLAGEEAFTPKRDALVQKLMARQTNQQIARAAFADITPAVLLEKWQTTYRRLTDALSASDAKRRLPWFGPDMGVRMFTTARYMEVWSHSQEIYDLMQVARTYDDRIRNIVTIGMKTFAWTFVNRGEEVPGPPPYVRLEAPSGEIWEYGEPSETESVQGSAAEFCHVVTQGRNIADVGLAVKGPIATRWMSVAQCFAGGAIDPPKPGTRG